jgi:hypothetical protein
MPADNRIRPYDDQAPALPGKPSAGENPETAMFVPQPWPDLSSLQNNQLLPTTKFFGD